MGDLGEIKNSPAYAFLNELQKQGRLSQQQYGMRGLEVFGMSLAYHANAVLI